MRRNNILFISHSSKLYGAEKSLVQILNNLDRNKFNIHLVLPSPGKINNRINNSITIHYVTCPCWVNNSFSLISIIKIVLKELLSTFRIAIIIKKNRIQLVYTNSIVNFSGIFSSTLTNSKHCWHIREIFEETDQNRTYKSFIPTRYVHKLISLSTKIICNSNTTANRIKTKKCKTIIYNAIDLTNIPSFSNEDRDNNSQEWAIAHVGGLSPNKAQDISIKAFAKIQKKINNSKLYIIGFGRDKDYISKLKRLVDDLNISESVHFTGYIDNIYPYLSQCKALLVPSFRESFGKIAIEGMSAGTVVIASRIDALKEIIQHKKTGLLFSPGSIDGLANNILWVYQNHRLSSKISKEAQLFANNTFTLHKYITSVENIIDNAICEGSTA